ncbi:hypothetical protein D3G93_24380 [Escherichia coli]|nr:hypothetical protein [Escherichia coli]EFN9781099.1 hypothetical protein [Escherichia coli]
MRKILMYLCISIWIVISCVPIILTSEYLTEASIMALMFGHANALCIGGFISIIYIECWR